MVVITRYLKNGDSTWLNMLAYRGGESVQIARCHFRDHYYFECYCQSSCVTLITSSVRTLKKTMIVYPVSIEVH